ncbi:hypothetical protein MicvaDRAFT_4952 [Microcoleus vaginatus FGP-2]|nr:hypothetical protein MicvaDRAFT_4952 [Microcoleus vaginatus FGP-2]
MIKKESGGVEPLQLSLYAGIPNQLLSTQPHLQVFDF